MTRPATEKEFPPGWPCPRLMAEAQEVMLREMPQPPRRRVVMSEEEVAKLPLCKCGDFKGGRAPKGRECATCRPHG